MRKPYQNLRIAFVDPGARYKFAAAELSLESVLREVMSSKLVHGIEAKNLHTTNLEKYDVLILPQGIIGRIDIVGDKGKKIKEFVRRGGICWIMHQEMRGWFSPLFPEQLLPIEIENEYLDREPGFFSPDNQKEYVCPWILDRTHPVWNKPHYLDEGDFLYWRAKIAGREYATCATHVIFVPKRWEILAAFADDKVKIRHRASMVCEAGYGKGSYFWTQIFPPEFVWGSEGTEKKTYLMFLDNILTYFEDIKRGNLFKAKIEPEPWSIKSGEEVNLNVKSEKKIKKVNWEIEYPDGKEKTVRTASSLVYKPDQGGTYRVRAEISTKDGALAIAHTFFKAAKTFTPFRFLTHSHFTSCWTPESLGALFGACRKNGIDGVVLAAGLFYGDENLCSRIEDEELKFADSPAVRFFPGEELHCMHAYNEKEGAIEPDKYDTRRHATSIGCTNLYPYSREYWDPKILVKIHESGGLGIAAHPSIQRWWMRPQSGHNFEGVEIGSDETHQRWDEMLRKGKFVAGISAIDLQKVHLCSPNIGWFDEPFTIENLLNTVLKGRITVVPVFPKSSWRKNNFLWFDINHQVVGGTVYAVDKIALNIQARSHIQLSSLSVIKKGNRGYKKVKCARKHLTYSMVDEVKGDSYYRIELGYDGSSHRGISNPIFVRKVRGPKGGYFYFQNAAPRVFDKEDGRYYANLTKVKKVVCRKGIWEIEFFEPGKGRMFIGGIKIKEAKLDSKKITCQKSSDSRKEIQFLKGYHKVKVDIAASKKTTPS